MSIFSLEQGVIIHGMKGTAETIRAITRSFADEPCPLLKTQVSEVKKLADALSIMARKLGIKDT